MFKTITAPYRKNGISIESSKKKSLAINVPKAEALSLETWLILKALAVSEVSTIPTKADCCIGSAIILRNGEIR